MMARPLAGPACWAIRGFVERTKDWASGPIGFRDDNNSLGGRADGLGMSTTTRATVVDYWQGRSSEPASKPATPPVKIGGGDVGPTEAKPQATPPSEVTDTGVTDMDGSPVAVHRIVRPGMGSPHRSVAKRHAV